MSEAASEASAKGLEQEMKAARFLSFSPFNSLSDDLDCRGVRSWPLQEPAVPAKDLLPGVAGKIKESRAREHYGVVG